MRLITENDVIDLIKKMSGYKGYISVVKPLKLQHVIEKGKYDFFRKNVEQEFEIKCDQSETAIKDSSTILEIVDYINGQKGLNNFTIRKLFENICEQNASKMLVRFENEELTYEEMYRKVKKFANGLVEEGVRKGTHVAIILDNCLEYILLYFALFYIGAVPIPINTRWLNQEIKNVLADSGAEYIVAQESSGRNKFYETINEMLSTTRQIHKVFYMGRNFYAEKGVEINRLKKKETNYIFEEIGADDVAMISYTSGTTGTPKGVVLNQIGVVKISLYATRLIMKGDTSLSIAPLYSAQGFLSLLINFASENTFEMLSNFNPNEIIKEVSKGEVTIIHTQPTMWTILLNCKLINFARFDSMKKLVVSGSLCTPELAKRIEKKIGCRIINVYGLIEGTSVVTMTREEDTDEVRYNTVGRPIPGVQIKIVNEAGEDVQKGEIGELCVKGQIMKGYYKNQEMTDRVIDKAGWLHTGDLAKYYDDENISIVGRCKDMVIRGGFNVYPSDIEEIIMQIPEVQTVAVIGKPNEVLGEEIVAFVVPSPGVNLDKNKISRYTFENLSNYKQPDRIYFINDMPVVLAGKIDKKKLSEWLVKGIPLEKQILFK